jgi:hypothetical protein
MQQLPGRIRAHAFWIMAEMQGNVANGELPASPVPAAFFPTICPRNQGHLRNGERFP